MSEIALCGSIMSRDNDNIKQTTCVFSLEAEVEPFNLQLISHNTDSFFNQIMSTIVYFKNQYLETNYKLASQCDICSKGY